MNKRIIALTLALLMLIPLTACSGKGDENFKPEDFEFAIKTAGVGQYFENGYTFVDLDDGTVMITEGDISGDISIPSELSGKKVSAIGDGAFFGNTAITSIVIPDTVESIGVYAFSDCTALASVTFGSKVWRIAPFAFDNTPYFSSLTDEFVTVGDGVLIAYNGTSRTPVIPDNVRHLGGAFAGNSNIYTLTLGRGVLTISDMALSFCTNLSEIDFGLSLVYIGDQAFSGSENITALVFPDTLRYIGMQACLNCYALKYVYLGKSITDLGDNAFEYCQALRVVYVPKSITSIKTSEFTDCMSLSLLLYEGTEAEFDTVAVNDIILSFKNVNKVFNYTGGANE